MTTKKPVKRRKDKEIKKKLKEICKNDMPRHRPKLYTEEIKLKLFTNLYEWSKNPDSFTIKQWCKESEIYFQRLDEWQQNNADFKELYKKAVDNCEVNLSLGGLKGDLQPTIAKVALSRHGWVEKSESTVNHKADFLSLIEATDEN